MSVTSISDLSRQHMLNILGFGSGSQSSPSTGNSVSTSGQLSPFAQMLTELQQLEQSNPAQYAKVSQQISTNLSTAASKAQTRGDSSLASQLTTLSKDFSTASQTGQLPNVSDLASLTATANSAAAPAPQNKMLNVIGKVLNVAGL